MIFCRTSTFLHTFLRPITFTELGTWPEWGLSDFTDSYYDGISSVIRSVFKFSDTCVMKKTRQMILSIYMYLCGLHRVIVKCLNTQKTIWWEFTILPILQSFCFEISVESLRNVRFVHENIYIILLWFCFALRKEVDRTVDFFEKALSDEIRTNHVTHTYRATPISLILMYKEWIIDTVIALVDPYNVSEKYVQISDEDLNKTGRQHLITV